jgi:hypothetical protein
MLVENMINNDFQSPRGATYIIFRPSGALIQNNNIISTNPDNYRIGVKLIFRILIQICHVNSVGTFIVTTMPGYCFF